MSPSFNWAKQEAQIGWDATHRYQVLNDRSSYDIWPVIAACTTWGYGEAGTFGFYSTRVRNRSHGGKYTKFLHSDYFTPEFVRKYWIPFLQSGEIVRTEWDGRTKAPWWMNVLGLLPLNWVLFVVFPAAAMLCSLNHTFRWELPLPRCCVASVHLEGTVIDSESRRGLNGAHVEIRGIQIDGRILATKTDVNGYFRFSQTQPRKQSRVQLYVACPGYKASLTNPLWDTESLAVPLTPER